MSPLPNHTAILVFSRTASAEAKAKNFFRINSFRHNRQFAKFLFQQSVRTARLSGLPYFICTEKEQRGTSFGERLSNAMEDVFANGFQKVIVVGNDCPLLNSTDLVKAVSLMEEASMIMTPTGRGGVSLLGISKEGFDKESFAEISWQTGDVSAELSSLAKSAQFSLLLLSPKEDINSHVDLSKQISHLDRRHSFWFFTRSLLASLAGFNSRKIDYCFRIGACSFFGLRAPPVCC